MLVKTTPDGVISGCRKWSCFLTSDNSSVSLFIDPTGHSILNFTASHFLTYFQTGTKSDAVFILADRYAAIPLPAIAVRTRIAEERIAVLIADTWSSRHRIADVLGESLSFFVILDPFIAIPIRLIVSPRNRDSCVLNRLDAAARLP